MQSPFFLAEEGDIVWTGRNGQTMESNSLNIYERDRVSKKAELSRDKVAGWQEVVAPLQSAIPNLSEEGDHPSLSFLLYFSMFFFLGWGHLISLWRNISAHISLVKMQ